MIHMSQKIQRDGIEDIKEKLVPVLKHYNVTKAGLFGSAARSIKGR